jgi:uncharacterized cupredoxin-like copper-binding protein
VTWIIGQSYNGAVRKTAALALCGALAFGLEAIAAEELVTVQLVDDQFLPEKLRFRAGIAYRLRLENNGTHLHEFTAPEFLKAIEVKNPEVLEQGQHEVLLQPRERKELVFVARDAGRYPLLCADHDWDGMVGEITIE